MRWWQYNSWARWYMQRKGMTTKPGQSVAWAGLETTIIWRCCLTHLTKNHAHLVGGIPTPLKNMKVSWDDYPHIWKNKKCFKPPTSHELASSAALRCQRMTAWFSNSPLAVTHSVQASQKNKYWANHDQHGQYIQASNKTVRQLPKAWITWMQST